MKNRNWTRRTFVKTFGLGCFSGSLPGNAATSVHRHQGVKPPNIVILVADDLGWNDVGYRGSDIKTPCIDALAGEGIELDRFYVSPVCSPTRAGLLTGRYPQRYGFSKYSIKPWSDFGLSPDEECLPQLLDKAGYTRRACIGKWHLGHSRKSYHPLSRGFTYFYGHYNGAIDYFTHEREGEMDWHRNFDPNFDKGYSTTLLSNEAVRFIDESTSSDPFFLYVPFNAPHRPLQAEKDLLEAYGFDSSKSLFSNSNDAYGREGKGNTKRQTYSAMVAALDNAVGRILNALERKRLTNNTLILFFSDNGGRYRQGGSNKPLKGEKHTLWEGGVRVPALIRWPERLRGGQKFDKLMGYIDLLPTVLAASGFDIKTRNTLDGVNMLPAMTGKVRFPNREFYLGKGAVVSRDWKLIKGKLFHLSTDPGETTDVAASNPGIANALKKRLMKFEAMQSSIRFPSDSGRPKNFKAPKEWKIE